MIPKILILLGTWLFCDGLFSIHVYWGKENIREHYIRVIRMIVGIGLIIIGMRMKTLIIDDVDFSITLPSEENSSELLQIL